MKDSTITIRKQVYETIWEVITSQLKNHIAIRDDLDDDRLDDIDTNLEVAKYNGTISWCLWRDGQELIVNAHDNGNITLYMNEQAHKNIVINIDYKGNLSEYLSETKHIVDDLVYTFLEGNWHILFDYLCLAKSDNTDWKKQLALYKQYEASDIYECVNITYI